MCCELSEKAELYMCTYQSAFDVVAPGIYIYGVNFEAVSRLQLSRLEFSAEFSERNFLSENKTD